MFVSHPLQQRGWLGGEGGEGGGGGGRLYLCTAVIPYSNGREGGGCICAQLSSLTAMGGCTPRRDYVVVIKKFYLVTSMNSGYVWRYMYFCELFKNSCIP